MLDQVLSRALRLTVADIDSDGEVVIARRIACIHEAQVELAARMTVELGSESAAYGRAPYGRVAGVRGGCRRLPGTARPTCSPRTARRPRRDAPRPEPTPPQNRKRDEH